MSRSRHTIAIIEHELKAGVAANWMSTISTTSTMSYPDYWIVRQIVYSGAATPGAIVIRSPEVGYIGSFIAPDNGLGTGGFTSEPGTKITNNGNISMLGQLSFSALQGDIAISALSGHIVIVLELVKEGMMMALAPSSSREERKM